jgi:predicted GIY-YIG superfamily endonuclease
VVEQRTHKPLVAGSIPAPGTIFTVHYVYLLRGGSGRHYIGMTSDLARRVEQHRRGQTHTTKRLGGELQLVADKAYESREEAAAIE